MKDMYNIDGLPGITMQGIQGSEGERGCNTITVSPKASREDLLSKKKFICIFDDDNDGYTYISSESAEGYQLTTEIYESLTGVKKEENDSKYFAIANNDPIIGDYIMSPESQGTILFQIASLIEVEDITSLEYQTKHPSISADIINEISAYCAYVDTMADDESGANNPVGCKCAIVKKVDEWTYTPSSENMEVDMEVAVESVKEYINNSWNGRYSEIVLNEPVKLTYIENGTSEARVATLKQKMIERGVWYKASEEHSTVVIQLLNINTQEPISGIEVYLYTSESKPASVSEFPSEITATVISDDEGKCTFQIPTEALPCYVLYVLTKSTNDASREMKDRYDAVCMPFRYSYQKFYMHSSYDIERSSEMEVPVYIPTFNSASCDKGGNTTYTHSVFTIKSTMKDEEKKKIKVVAEFTSIYDGIYHFDSVLYDKVEDANPFKISGTSIVEATWDHNPTLHNIGEEEIYHDITSYDDTANIPEGRHAKYPGGDRWLSYDYYNLIAPPAGAAIQYPIDGTFSFDSESPRRFNLVLKDFEEGNSGTEYESEVFLPTEVALKYNVDIYIIVDTGVSGLKRIRLGSVQIKDTLSDNEESQTV